MLYPDIPYTTAHKQLRRRLERYKWSVAELRWLASHAKNVPSSLEKLILDKLKQAEEEVTHGEPEHLVLLDQ